MVGDNIQLTFQDRLVAEPFTDITNITLEVQIAVTQLNPGVSNLHLAVRITELDRRDHHCFRQPLRYIEFAVLEVHFQPRVPLQQDILFSGFVPRSGFQIQFTGLGSQLLSHPGIECLCPQFGLQPRSRLVFASAGERSLQMGSSQVGFDILEEPVQRIAVYRRLRYGHDGRVLGVILGIQLQLRCIDRATHRIHLHLHRTLALQPYGSIENGIFGQHITCLQLDRRGFERSFQRRRHLEIHFVGRQVDPRPVNLRFGRFGVRQLDRSMGLRQIGYHRIHRIMNLLQVQIGIDSTLLQPHRGQVVQTDLRFRCTLGFAVQRHGFRQEIRKVRQVGIEVQRQIK